MSKWHLVRALRKEKIFEVSINQSFNLEVITGIKNWINPQFLISIKKFINNGGGYIDSRVEISGNYPNYKCYSLNGGGIVKIYVTEGDGQCDVSPTNGNWKQVLSLSRQNKGIFTLSSNNNYRCNIQQIYSKSGKYECLVFFKNIIFPTMVKEYSIDTNINSGWLHVNIRFMTPILNNPQHITNYNNTFTIRNTDGFVYLGGTIVCQDGGYYSQPSCHIKVNNQIVSSYMSKESGYWELLDIAPYLLCCNRNETYNISYLDDFRQSNITWETDVFNASSNLQNISKWSNTDEIIVLVVGL